MALKIVIAGDYSPVGSTNKAAIAGNYDEIFNESMNLIKDADLAVVSFESTLTERNEKLHKIGAHIKADKGNIGALKYAGFTIATLANNHIMDFGADGLLSTIIAFKEAGLDYVGVGESLFHARESRTFLVKGKKIAILNFAENEFSTTNADYPGANPIDPINNYIDISKAKKEADFIIVIVHGGIEDFQYPSPNMKKLFRFYIDSGASAVLCSHSHCFSGYERYNNGLIFYGLGNFIFEWFIDKKKKINKPWNFGYMVRLVISDTIDFEIFPYKQNSEKFGVHLLGGNDKVKFLKEIDAINSIIRDDNKLEELFNGLSKERDKIYRLALITRFNFLFRMLLKISPQYDLIPKRKVRLVTNLIRCESHREVLLNVLKQNV